MAGNDLVDRIAEADPSSGALMRAHNAAFLEQPLPFYRRFRAVVVTVELPHKPIEFRFADDGAESLPLGTAEGIYAVNDREQLRLEPAQVAPYMRFFFACTSGRTRYLVENASDAPWIPAAAMDPEMERQKAAAQSLIQPMGVATRPDGRFAVVATAIDQRTLLRLSFVVSTDGRVEAAEPVPLLEDVPVPYVGL